MTDTQNPSPTPLTRKQLTAKYNEAVLWLDENFAYFLTHVLKIGRPEWTEAAKTAAVSLDLRNKPGLALGKTDEIDYDEFMFMFAPSFLAQLNLEETAFILAHETMHILLNHLKLSESFVDRDIYYKLKEKSEKNKRFDKSELVEWVKQQQNAMRFNIAADCVINDYLVNAGMHPVKGLMRGQDKVGMDCSYLTVSEVYDKLLDQAQQECPSCGGTGKKPKDDEEGEKDKGDQGESDSGQDQGDENQDGSGDEKSDQGGKGKNDDHDHGDEGEPCPDCQGSGRGTGQPGDSGGVGGTYEPLDNHDWMLDPKFAEQLADALDKLQDEVDQQTGMPQDLLDKIDEEAGKQSEADQKLQQSMKAGTEDGNFQKFVQTTGVNMAWAKLLKEVDPMMFKEPGIAPPPLPSFHRQSRKLGAPAFRKTVLPVYRIEERRDKDTNQKPAIVMALDTSGSIGPTDAARFVSLAQTIPQERIKLFIITFTTCYRELDLENPQYTSGGTDFTCIPQYINDVVKPANKGKYPSAVVVITDGEAPLDQHVWPDENEAKAWFWLMSPYDRGGSYYPASSQIGRRDTLDNFITV